MIPGTPVRMTRAGLARTLQTSVCPERGEFVGYTHDPGSATYRRLVKVRGAGTDGKEHVGVYQEDSWERVPDGMREGME
jgi:hypothetical protein